jgi:hypothetical protein
LTLRAEGHDGIIGGRRLTLESLEPRSLLAAFALADSAQLLGTVTDSSQYTFTSGSPTVNEVTANFYGAQSPSSASVGVSGARTANSYTDVASGSAQQQLNFSSVNLEIAGQLGASLVTSSPASTINGRNSSVSFFSDTSSPIRIEINPTGSEQIGDMVGVSLQFLVNGQIFGADVNAAPQGVFNATGSYSYEYTILTPNGIPFTGTTSHSGSGSITQLLGTSDTLDDFGDGPINVPVGSEIDVTMELSGSISTTDLKAVAQLTGSVSANVSFAQADLIAQPLSWNVHNSTDQSQRYLNFAYEVNSADSPLTGDTEADFYWASGPTQQDILGSLAQPVYSYAITQPDQKTVGTHSGSVSLSTLGTPVDGTTDVLMILDPNNQISEVSTSNTLADIAVLPDVQATGLTWDTQRDEDPYGSWRGLDGQYTVGFGAPPASTQVAFYWSTTNTAAGEIGQALSPQNIDPSLGLHQFNEPAEWGTPPTGTNYVLMVIDPNNLVDQWTETNNLVAIQLHSAAQILAGSINFSPPGAGTYDGTQPNLNVWFEPGGDNGGQGQYTMSEAEVALGVDHFNWLQQVYSVPSDWSLTQDYTANGGTIPLPWIDPSDTVPNQSYLVLTSTVAGTSENFAANPNDSAVFYYNEPGYDHSVQVNVQGVTHGSYMSFFDAPRVPANFLTAGESWAFVCSLEGVNSQGQIVPLPASSSQQTTFTWQSNAVYDPQDSGSSVTGGGIYLQVLDPSTAPPVVSGGVSHVALAAVPAPVAVNDAASTGGNTPAIVRVMANDYDPQGYPLQITYVSQPSHGTVTINDAGTPSDFSDDSITYTPNAGFTGTDTFQYMISRGGSGSGSAVAQVTISVTPPILGMGVVGDGLSEDYADQSLSYAQNWVQLLGSTENINFGGSGYPYDLARVGATSQIMLTEGQASSVAQQVQSGQVTDVVLMIGQEDFDPGGDAYTGIYMQGLPQQGGWTSQQVQNFADGVVTNISTALAQLKASGAKVVLSNIMDYSLLPYAQQTFPDAGRRVLVGGVIAGINQQIAALAAAQRVPMIDLSGLSQLLLGTPLSSVTIGGVTLTNTSGQDPHNLFTADGIHPGTVFQAALANLVLEGFSLGYGVNVPLLSEQQMVQAAGLTYGGQNTLNVNYGQYVQLPPNHAPVAVADSYVDQQGQPLTVSAAGGLLANDSDADGDPLTAVLVGGGPAHGTLTLAANGSFVYQPTYDYYGSDSFQYEANDGYTNSNVVTVSVTVVTPAQSNAFTPGLYVPGQSVFYLRNENATGAADITFAFGQPGAGWIPLAGDWYGTQAQGVGLYDPVNSLFYLTGTNGTGIAQTSFGFGAPGAGWIPLAGDFTGDGTTTVALYNPATSQFYLRNSNSTGAADLTVAYGPAGAGWIPLIGDWTGSGTDTVGLYNPATSVFFLRTSNTTGMANITFGFGPAGAGWIPVVGDWNGDGVDTVGLYDPATSEFYLRNSNSTGAANVTLGFGAAAAGWLPLAGDWDASRSTSLLAAGAGTGTTTTITAAQLAPLVQAAQSYWTATGLSADQLSRLNNVQVTLAALPSGVLARSFGQQVVISSDAAGLGYFVDPTPNLSGAFTAATGSAQLTAVNSQAVDQIDLLTVVSHELGEVIGQDDLNASLDMLMSSTLPVGVRRLPT